MVTLHVSGFSGTSTTTAFETDANDIPANIRPAGVDTILQAVWVEDNGTVQQGWCLIQGGTGQIRFTINAGGVSSTDWTNSGTKGVSDFYVTYFT